MKASSSDLLRALGKQVFSVGGKVSADKLQLVKASGIVPDALLADPQSPEFKQAAALLRAACPFSKKVKVWKTVTLGGLPAGKLLAELEANGYKPSPRAKEIMSKPEFLITPAGKLKIGRVRVRDLGFTEPPTTPVLHARIERAVTIGLLPADAMPYIRQAYPDQPMGEVLWAAMRPITDSGVWPSVFRVKRDAFGLWLGADVASADAQWLLDHEILVALR